MAQHSIVALVTQGFNGLGYHIGKELLKCSPKTFTYLTARGDFRGLPEFLGFDVGGRARNRAEFVNMDITHIPSVNELKESILGRWETGLDIMVINNAALYEPPDLENFPEQTKNILEMNYYGYRNVLAFFPYSHLNNGARILTITPNLPEVTGEQNNLMRFTSERFNKVENIYELDDLVMKFLRDVEANKASQEGWPSCAYTVSNMAINCHTRLYYLKVSSFLVPSLLSGFFRRNLTDQVAKTLL